MLPLRRRRGSRAGVDGHGKPGAAAKAPPWFMCGRGGAVLDASAQCERSREAMRAGVEGSCVRRTRVWELHPNGCHVPNVGASRPEIRMILKNKNEIQTLRF